MENQRRSQRSTGTSWLLNITPSLPIALLGVGGWLSETLLLALSRNNIYQMTGLMPALAGLLLAWFWLTGGWVLWGAVRALRSGRRPLSVKAATMAVGFWVIAIVGLVIYVASW